MMNFTPLMMSSFDPASPRMEQPGDWSRTVRPLGREYCKLVKIRDVAQRQKIAPVVFDDVPDAVRTNDRSERRPGAPRRREARQQEARKQVAGHGRVQGERRPWD